jgi:hypothetical protein
MTDLLQNINKNKHNWQELVEFYDKELCQLSSEEQESLNEEDSDYTSDQ